MWPGDSQILGMGSPEFGTVRISEFESFRGPFQLRIERDKFFEAKAPISRYIEAARDAGYITEQVTP